MPSRQLNDVAHSWGCATVGLGIALVLGVTTPAGIHSTFWMSTGGDRGSFGLVVPTRAAVVVLGSLCLAIGALRLTLGLPRRRVATVCVAVLAAMALVIWLSRGAEFSLVGMLQTTISRATPLTLGAMAGILCEKAGVVNIAIEAMMLFSAFGGAIAASLTGNLWIGLIVGLTAGAAVAYLHAGLSITFSVDQIISGTVLNIVVLGVTSFLAGGLLRSNPRFNDAGTFARVHIPGLADIPVLGPVLFQQNIYVYLMYVLVPLLGWTLVGTRWGLRVRAVGENPWAADAVGVNVSRTRFRSVLLGGAMAGLAGSYLSLGSLGSFESGMTAGRGFIALAAMIIGGWKPLGALGAALLFGFTEALQTKLAIISTPVPAQFLIMAPYVVTLLVVAGFVGRSRPPAADGVAYPRSRQVEP